MKRKNAILTILSSFFLATACVSNQRDDGWTTLFDGRSLDGWTLKGKKGEGYGVKDGILYCARGGGGNLFTQREYTDFTFAFEFKLEDGANNGIGIRAPLEGDAAYAGMEIQVLDDTAPKYAKLRPSQYHGSIYDVFAARRGALKPIGQWNQEEITCVGRHVTVKLNGKVILDANLNDVTDRETLKKHPGLLREGGHIGFLGHNDFVEFRNIRIKDLSTRSSPSSVKHNQAPDGFIALFNGKDLSGWKGLVADPPKRAKMSARELSAAQAKADELMRASWKVENGLLNYRGKGFDNLCTEKDYGDFELWVDWKIQDKEDSGLYLRGTPQVQIWGDPIGSGGLFNNKNNPSKPTTRADRIGGEWNRFKILMIDDKVTIFLNEQVVVPNVTLENYWERDKKLYEKGAIELQAHKDPISFRNIYVREIRTPSKAR